MGMKQIGMYEDWVQSGKYQRGLVCEGRAEELGVLGLWFGCPADLCCLDAPAEGVIDGFGCCCEGSAEELLLFGGWLVASPSSAGSCCKNNGASLLCCPAADIGC
ncbi:hypothetical protein LOK49_LG06G00607 [Camellia lanceoleosa]|uniref:Uncharacterized protein n=1 Tax=Camellia lanceoleosa TaxID=1840588 RepID=A0ACC0HEW3_9ERIC|nr:hypothetical protein LOK49_LG06G00607 [Camellia lanceoleosa]